MATKKSPALTAQLKVAQVEVEALKKTLAQLEIMRKYHADKAEKAEAELQQIHAFLDAVPTPPARKTPVGEYGAVTEHTTMTRLSVYLATRGS